jgi:DinB superfamily
MEPSPRIALLLRTLDQAYDRKSWHGTTLRGSLRQVSAEDAAWRPAPERHNVWELAVHAAYWKYSILRRIRRLDRGSFPLEGSNWFPRPADPSERAWREDLALLGRMHRDLRQAVAELSDDLLDEAPAGSTTSLADVIVGGAFHDIYHAGQIQLLKRLRAG